MTTAENTRLIELVGKARAMQPWLRERAAAVEEARSVPRETIAAFREAGFFRMYQPRALGGYEVPPAVFGEVVEQVAAACGSSGWVLAVLALHSWEVPHLSARAQDDIWGTDRDALLSSAYAPTGKVVRVEGGYRLEGAWPFSSGVDHAAWTLVGGLVEGEAPPVMRSFAVPRTDLEIVDDWHTVGLAGTGSKTVRLRGTFVPEHRAHPIFGATPPPPAGIADLYKLPFGMVFLDAVAAPAFGIARGVLGAYVERNAARRGAFDGAKYADNPDVHRYIAETDYAIRAAAALMRQNQHDEFAAAREGREITLLQRARHMWEVGRAVHACAEAVTRLYAVSGAHAIFRSDPLQRAVRDIQAMCTHIGFNFNAEGRNYGAMCMGHPNTIGLI